MALIFRAKLKENDDDIIIPQSGNMSRTGDAFYHSGGYVKQAAEDEPRFQQYAGEYWLLQEGVGENIFPYSEDFSDDAWNVSNMTKEAASGVADPTGGSGTYLLQDNTDVNVYHSFNDTTHGTLLDDDTSYTFSLYVKKEALNYIQLFSLTKAGAYNSAIFDLDTATWSGTPSVDDYGFEEIGNSWYRLWITNDVGSGATEPKFYVQTRDAENNAQYTGTGQGYYIWGAQLEAAAYISSYIHNDKVAFDDDFTDPGTSLNTYRWNAYGDPNSMITINDYIKIEPAGNGDDGDQVTITSANRMYIQGDFDIYMQFSNVSWSQPSAGTQNRFDFEVFIDSDNKAVLRMEYTTGGTWQYRWTGKEGGITNWNDTVATTDTSGYLRFVRSGSNISGYYGSPGSWTQIGSTESWVTTDCYILLYFDADDVSTWTSMQWDQIVRSSGNFKIVGYRWSEDSYPRFAHSAAMQAAFDTDGEGTLICEYVPLYAGANQGDNNMGVVAATANLLNVFYVGWNGAEYKSHDGTAAVAVTVAAGDRVRGTVTRIGVQWGSSNYRIGYYTSASGWTWGTEDSYDGAFGLGTNLLTGEDNTMPFLIREINIFDNKMTTTEIENYSFDSSSAVRRNAANQGWKRRKRRS